MRVDWVKAPVAAPRFATLGQAATYPAPPGWTGPWPPPRPPFWELTGLQWLPTGDFPAERPALYPAFLEWPPPRPPGYPAAWEWPLKPPPGWLTPPASAPTPTPVIPPPGSTGPAPSSSSSSGSGDSAAYVIGGAIVLGIFVLLAATSLAEV